MNQAIAFIKKHRILILGTLVVLIILQWCQYQANTKYRQNAPHYSQSIRVEEPQSQSAPEQEEPQGNPWLPYFILVGMVVVVYVAQKQGWMEKLVPGRMSIRAKLFKQNNRQMLRIYFLNTSQNSHDVDAPVVEFMRAGEQKAFRLKVNDNDISFPITLTQRTSHLMVIDLQQFYERIPDLKKFYWIRIKATIDSNTVQKTFPMPVWSAFLRK
jgi:hypothetical protein